MNKTKSLLIACAVSVLATAPLGSAFAQGEHQQQQQRRQDQREPERGQNRGNEQRGDSRENNRDGRDNRRGNDQHSQQRPDNRDHNDNNNGRYGNRGRGAGPDHNFYVGNRLPPAYRQRTYVVNDWRSHQLRSPPRGYQWVQNGGDYLLVAIATGVILDLILNN